MKQLIMVLLGSMLLAASALAAVDINTATADQLEALPGIGATKAKAIVDYRAKNGPFKSTDELTRVPGIKQGTYAKIKGELSVGRAATPAKATTAKK
ncbi:helix-hairpin-helix domain-containing protein [Chitiniphilus purpureus]|uniref:Helix-hairpin-helix domain-containing protein n=1 Tax=Chitiniphilus purpureus TaxID=2981137 RepID=A0ABY6DKE0_9NEIS|nr:helix-hairpin-helix domain-containing protein [Chitiniphilus sp. CD1]UXY14830.1 helix-hairpin-helix domain-containing protein [Chitiniphilus sp. CD1]